MGLGGGAGRGWDPEAAAGRLLLLEESGGVKLWRASLEVALQRDLWASGRAPPPPPPLGLLFAADAFLLLLLTFFLVGEAEWPDRRGRDCVVETPLEEVDLGLLLLLLLLLWFCKSASLYMEFLGLAAAAVPPPPLSRMCAEVRGLPEGLLLLLLLLPVFLVLMVTDDRDCCCCCCLLFTMLPVGTGSPLLLVGDRCRLLESPGSLAEDDER